MLSVSDVNSWLGYFYFLQVHHHEFIPMFEKQYPSHKWADIEVDINTYLVRLR